MHYVRELIPKMKLGMWSAWTMVPVKHFKYIFWNWMGLFGMKTFRELRRNGMIYHWNSMVAESFWGQIFVCFFVLFLYVFWEAFFIQISQPGFWQDSELSRNSFCLREEFRAFQLRSWWMCGLFTRNGWSASKVAVPTFKVSPEWVLGQAVQGVLMPRSISKGGVSIQVWTAVCTGRVNRKVQTPFHLLKRRAQEWFPLSRVPSPLCVSERTWQNKQNCHGNIQGSRSLAVGNARSWHWHHPVQEGNGATMHDNMNNLQAFKMLSINHIFKVFYNK